MQNMGLMNHLNMVIIGKIKADIPIIYLTMMIIKDLALGY